MPPSFRGEKGPAEFLQTFQPPSGFELWKRLHDSGMAVRFYERYVPPAKVHEAHTKSDEKQNRAPLLDASDQNGVPPNQPKPTKKLMKRSALDTDIEHRPRKRISPEPKSQWAGSSTESVKEPEVIDSSTDNGLTPVTQPIQSLHEVKIAVLSALPGWIRDPVIASNTVEKSFEEFPLSDNVKANLSKEEFSMANGLQCRVLPMLLPGYNGPERYCGDVCISAATGSGKTLAYALPLIESLRDKPVTRLRGLLVVPTRELVSQAHKTLDMIAAGTGIKLGVAVGKNRLKDEQESLVEKYQRWSPEASRSQEEVKIEKNDELIDWDLDFAESLEDSERQPDHVLDYSSKVDILICTPGRLVDHIKYTKGFHLHHIQWLVIDEADRLLDESFQEWISNVMPLLEHLSPNTKLKQQIFQTFGLSQPRRIRKIVLSATMSKDLSKLGSLHLSRPKMVILEGATEQQGVQKDHLNNEEGIKLPESLVEVAMAVTEANYKPLYVIQLLQEFAAFEIQRDRNADSNGDIKMTEANDGSEGSLSDVSSTSIVSANSYQNVSEQKHRRIPGTLVFAKSNESALRLARLLSMLLPEYQIRALTKSPGDKKGRKTWSMFSRGKVSVVVATDLASRGLDIPGLAYVINYDMPASLISYVHRVGRTARAGRGGRAVTLVEHKEGNWFWNDIARNKGLSRARKVTRMDGGLRASSDDRHRYEDALRDLGLEAAGKKYDK